MSKKLLVFFVLTILFSCEELIEVEDISNEVVDVLAPVDNVSVEDTTVNFTWEALDFAETYQLQIANPSFIEAEGILEDTLISATNFTKTLSIGTYQWRIKAINSGYQTLYSTQNLIIED
ncbi:hypothetical protein [uncultured Winogradskyella sp.]|uniref:hypothetical protein n=1 Tax=uncultured Winogradskyella sp. TaxID=395353 RepID=UPI002623B3BA|nr:hypothetical protein [uncultured Winogradskyella sp.]